MQIKGKHNFETRPTVNGVNIVKADDPILLPTTKGYMQFSRAGVLNAGTFLQNGAVVTSTTAGAMVCTSCYLRAVSVMNGNTISDGSGIEVLRNGTPVATLNISSGKSAFSSGLAIAFAAGDFISIRTKITNGSNLKDTQVTVEVQ